MFQYQAQSFIDSFVIWKGLGDLWIKQDDVRADSTFRVNSTSGENIHFREVVFLPEFIISLFLGRIFLHI